MINYYGVFQLVKVHNEDKTKRGDTVVFFTAASRRTEKDSDFKFFKMFGNEADFFLRNLLKGDDGKYKSRKMMIHGYVETYTENREVKCTANLTPQHIPQQLGFLNKNIRIDAKTTTKVEKDIYIVKNFEFVDTPKDMDIEVVVNDDMTEFTSETPIVNDNNKVSETKPENKIEKKNGNFVQNSIDAAFKDLDNMKNLEAVN